MYIYIKREKWGWGRKRDWRGRDKERWERKGSRNSKERYT